MLKIIKVESDGTTGHLTVHASVIENPTPNTTIEGAPETWGIVPQKLQEQYNGNPKEWLKMVHRTMLQNHENRKITAAALVSLQGLTVFDDEENESNGNQATP